MTSPQPASHSMVKGTALKEKDKVLTLTIQIQHSTGSPSQSNQARNYNKKTEATNHTP